MNNYTLDDIFDSSSPYYNGAVNLSNPPGGQNAFTNAIDPSIIGTNEQGEQMANISTKLAEITVAPEDSIQQALDKLDVLGGGVINLLVGTYTIPVLTGKSSVELRGISLSETILDANSTSANLSFAGTGVYATGTITSIANGVNVTGSGTSWLANVSAGQHFFLNSRWYLIAAVTGDTTLILAEGYGDDVTMPGAAYRIASVKQNIAIRNLTIKNSTGTGLALTDCRRIVLDNVLFLDNNKGAVLTNVSECNADRILAISNTSNGIELTNVGISDWESVNSISNGGSGFVLNNVETMTFSPCSATGNTADGINITSGVDLIMIAEASGNGGQGIELVATNSDITLQCVVKGNTSDGIKLTATTDNCKLTIGDIQSNGGYGVNIAASTCDNNVITSNTILSNSSGQVNDAGTGTLIRGNVGVDDNSTSSLSVAGLFGDGSDGDVTISVNTTLSADKYYNNLTINTGVTLTTAGYAVYVLGTCTTVGTGAIVNNGGVGGNGGTATSGVVGAAGVAGTGGAGATFTAGKAGGAGGVGVAETGGLVRGIDGAAGTACNPALGGNGGAGGNGSSVGGGTAGLLGAGGTATAETVLAKASAYGGSGNLSGTESTALKQIAGVGSISALALSPGAGGGGGGSGGMGSGSSPFNSCSGGGGGGGGSGGVLCLIASTIVNNGTISANGGNGGNGGNSFYDGSGADGVGGTGGGGGGGGGAVILIYESLTNNGTLAATGGTAGSGGARGADVGGVQNGDAGSNGSAGTVYKLKLI